MEDNIATVAYQRGRDHVQKAHVRAVGCVYLYLMFGRAERKVAMCSKRFETHVLVRVGYFQASESSLPPPARVFLLEKHVICT